MRNMKIFRRFSIALVLLLTGYILYVVWCGSAGPEKHVESVESGDDTASTETRMNFNDLIEEEVKDWGKFEGSEVPLNKAIFYIESQMKGHINSRQACSVESALLHHPNRLVFIIVPGANETSLDPRTDPVLRDLLDYPNLRLRYIDTVTFFKWSPLWNWFLTSDWQKTDQSSDYLRLAVGFLLLQKYGGTSISFSNLIVKKIPNLIGECEDRRLGLDLISLNFKNQFLEHVIDSLEKTLDSVILTSRRLTTLLLNFCKVDSLKDLRYKDCPGLGVELTGQTSTCPVEQSKHWILFDPNRRKMAESLVSSKETISINLWSSLSAPYQEWANTEFRTIFYDLADEHCPLTFKAAEHKL